MGIRDLFRARRSNRTDPRAAVGPMDPTDADHLAQWASTRVGVDGFIEPPTFINTASIVLVDLLGEWTRRPIGKVENAHALARDLNISVYDVTETGFPQRKRDFDRARELAAKREKRERLRAAADDAHYRRAGHQPRR